MAAEPGIAASASDHLPLHRVRAYHHHRYWCGRSDENRYTDPHREEIDRSRPGFGAAVAERSELGIAAAEPRLRAEVAQEVGSEQRAQAVRDDDDRVVRPVVLRPVVRDVAQQRRESLGDARARRSLERSLSQVVVDVEEDVEGGAAELRDPEKDRSGKCRDQSTGRASGLERPSLSTSREAPAGVPAARARRRFKDGRNDEHRRPPQ